VGGWPAFALFSGSRIRGLPLHDVASWMRSKATVFVYTATVLIALGVGFIAGVGTTGVVLDKRHFWPTARKLVSALAGRYKIPPYGETHEFESWRLAVRSEQIDGTDVMFGDSITFGFATSMMPNPTENLSIGGECIESLLYRLPKLRLDRARRIILTVGFNNWWSNKYGDFGSKYDLLLSSMPHDVPVVANAILPVNPRRFILASYGKGMLSGVAAANAVMKRACERHPNCRYVPQPRDLANGDGTLVAPADGGDGVHLTRYGYDVWRRWIVEHMEDERRKEAGGAVWRTDRVRVVAR
jgi:hypothetical protein